MICFLVFLSCLPFLSASSSHIISLPLIRHTYDRMPNPHEIHTMAVGTALTTQGCAVNNFFTPVQIGFNQYKLTVDTLYATTAIADVSCTNCNGITPLYTPGPTATLLSGALQQTYVDGRGWKGITYNDDITLPGTTLPKVNMGFAGITSQGAFFPTKRCDGLNLTTNNNQGTLGLGQPTAILPGTNAIFDTIIKSTSPPIDAIMAIQMCAVGGRLWLGGYDNNYMIGLPSFTAMSTSTSTYGATITDFLLGGASTNIPSSSFGTVVIDTTTTNMLFPQSIYTTIVSALTSNPDFIAAFGSTFFSDGLCIAPKSGLNIDDLNMKLPHLLIKMGTQVQLDMQPISSYIREFITLQNTNVGIMGNKLYCPGISVSPNPIRTTLGWTFLNQFTTIIDRVNQRIGFARTSNCGGFVGADANFITLSTTTTTTTTPFMKSGGFIGVIVAVVVVSVILLGITMFYGRRFFTGRQYNDKLKSLNYTTRSPNVKVQFADPVVGSKGFVNAGTQPTTRNAAHSVEEDGAYTDSPLASSPLSSSASDNSFSPMNEPIQAPPRPPRAMVASRGMNSPPIQQTTVQPTWSQQNSRTTTPNETPRQWSNPGTPSQRESPRQQNMQSWGNQAQQQSSWGNQSQQQQSWGNQSSQQHWGNQSSQQQQQWGNPSQQQSSWGNQARNYQQQPPRNPGQLNNQQAPPPRKYNGGGGDYNTRPQGFGSRY